MFDWRNGYEIWESPQSGEWYWHYKCKNGEIIAGGEGYKNKTDCLHAVGVLRASSGAKIWNLIQED
jgi:uncharacterized protein